MTMVRGVCRLLCFAAALTAWSIVNSGAHAQTSIWISDSLTKARRDATPGTDVSLRLYAARNEFVSFQVHLKPASAPVQMSVTVGDFVNRQTSDKIAAASSVTLYREAYLDITQASDANGAVGPTADPLIPALDRYTGEARNAFPVNVPVGQTQSAWIDVLVPATAPAGVYSASITVKNGSTTLARLPVTLVVWAFTLPSTASLRSAFGSSWAGMCSAAYGGYANCGHYPGSGGSADKAIELINQALATRLLDHRITNSSPVYYGPPTGDWSHFDATYGALLNGSAPTLLRGAKVTTMQYWSPSYQIVAGDITNWVNHFSAAGWLDRLFQYTCDEPPTGCTFAQAKTNEAKVHAASPLMKTLVTTDIAQGRQNGLLPNLNIFTPIVSAMEPQGGTNQRASYNGWLRGVDKHLWWYQACPQHGSCTNGVQGPASSTWPSYMIDATPVRNRVFQWLAFLDHIEGELYYALDYCWYNAAPQCGGSDPWTSVYAFGGNGDGTLIYPGTTDRIGGATPIALPSVRLKHIRDGMQDYEYLNALSQAGYEGYAKAIAHRFITNASTFNNDPAAMRAARISLGARLNQLAVAGQLGQPYCGTGPCKP